MESQLQEATDANQAALRWLQEAAEPSRTATATLGALAVLLGLSKDEAPTWAELKDKLGNNLPARMGSLQLSKEEVRAAGRKEYMERTKLAAKIFARSSSSQVRMLLMPMELSRNRPGLYQRPAVSYTSGSRSLSMCRDFFAMTRIDVLIILFSSKHASQVER